MKIVIDISEELYKNVIEQTKMGYVGSDVWIAVANGTPLPEGHGDLIDRDALNYELWRATAGVLKVIDTAKTVIPADNSEVD